MPDPVFLQNNSRYGRPFNPALAMQNWSRHGFSAKHKKGVRRPTGGALIWSYMVVSFSGNTMKIEKVKIQNFRSIQDIEIEPNYLTALIGSNSAGKTNILKALNILLGETYPTERAFTRDDFHKRDLNQTILIQVSFSEPIPCRLKSVADPSKKVQCAPVSLKFTHTENEEASFATKLLAVDLSGNEYWASGEIRDKISFVYIPSDRNLEKQMSISQWTLLGKILKKIDENFRKKEPNQELSELEQKFREAMKNPREILESEFGDDLNYKVFKEMFIDICKENTKGLASNFELDLEIYDPLFYYKTIQIIGKEELGNFNVNELGSGVQNLVLLSLFRTYAKLMKDKVILAIEEPEIYLYPQAQRQLYKNFRNLAYPSDGNPGTQIFYTTHNPSFVDAEHAYEVEMISKGKRNGTYNLKKNKSFLNSENSENQRFKIYTHFNTERNELFFANKVLLVEGYSDKILWTTITKEKWNIDIDREGISIIECGGKTGVIYFLGVCRLLGIENFFAVWDEDNRDGEIHDEHGHITSSLKERKGARNGYSHWRDLRHL